MLRINVKYRIIFRVNNLSTKMTFVRATRLFSQRIVWTHWHSLRIAWWNFLIRVKELASIAYFLDLAWRNTCISLLLDQQVLFNWWRVVRFIVLIFEKFSTFWVIGVNIGLDSIYATVGAFPVCRQCRLFIFAIQLLLVKLYWSI